MIVRKLFRCSFALFVCLLVAARAFGQQPSPQPPQTASASAPADPAQLPSARNKDDDQHSKDTIIQGPQRRLPNRRPITTSSIEGLVTSTEGRGIGGTTVVIRDTTGRLRAAMTDADGVFRVGDLNAGVYQVELRRQVQESSGYPAEPASKGEQDSGFRKPDLVTGTAA